MAQLYLMLIKVTPTVLAKPELRGWIDDIDRDYMEKYRHLGMSMAHIALENGDWDFALLFPGSDESVEYLTGQIMGKASGTKIQTMNATELDDFGRRGRHA